MGTDVMTLLYNVLVLASAVDVMALRSVVHSVRIGPFWGVEGTVVIDKDLLLR